MLHGAVHGHRNLQVKLCTAALYAWAFKNRLFMNVHQYSVPCVKRNKTNQIKKNPVKRQGRLNSSSV